MRACAIVTGQPYETVFESINKFAAGSERMTKRRQRLKQAGKKYQSNAWTGVNKHTTKRYIEKVLGWKLYPTMGIGTGCRVHLRKNELPKGKLLVNVSGHITVMIDGIINDTHNPTRGGKRCVYGFWYKPDHASESEVRLWEITRKEGENKCRKMDSQN